jgi:hypothetical protein
MKKQFAFVAIFFSVLLLTNSLPGNAERIDYSDKTTQPNYQPSNAQQPYPRSDFAGADRITNYIQSILSQNGLQAIPCNFSLAKLVFVGHGEACVMPQNGRFEAGTLYQYNANQNTFLKIGIATVVYTPVNGAQPHQGQQTTQFYIPEPR